MVTVAQGLAGAFATGRVGTPGHPARWDPRVADIAEFVEDERGLTFEHPVEVRFVPEADFRKEVETDEAELTEDDRDLIRQETAIFRALGLVEGDVDLFSSANALSGEGYVGLYDPSTEEILVRGTELTPEVRLTLAHELTHALQDQHFDIGRDDFDTSGASAGHEAVVEGDANRVENAYYEAELSDEEIEELDDDLPEELEEAIDEAPPVLASLFAAPYTLGDAFLELVIASGGNAARNRAIREPPVSEEQLLDPWRYLDGDEPADVELPDLAAGEVAIEQETDDFGAVAWYLVLAQRLDPRVALRAVDGWGGDAMVGFERKGTICVRARYTGDTAADTAEMRVALESWIAKGEAGAASVERDGDGLLFESCDPGTDAAPASTPLEGDLLSVPVIRTYIAAQGQADGAPDGLVRCAADKMIDLLSVEQLLDESGEAISADDVQALGMKAGMACGAEGG